MEVPDARLDRLNDIVRPKKRVPAVNEDDLAAGGGRLIAALQQAANVHHEDAEIVRFSALFRFNG